MSTTVQFGYLVAKNTLFTFSTKRQKKKEQKGDFIYFSNKEIKENKKPFVLTIGEKITFISHNI